MLAEVIKFKENKQGANCLLEKVKRRLDDLIIDSINDLTTEGEMILEMCEMDNDYHMCTYWISGTYDECYNFLSSIKDKKELNLIFYLIKNQYPNNVIKLKQKVKYKNYNQNGIILEMLATILLKQYQKEDIWCSVYGCEEEDMCDFNKNNIVNALKNQEEFPIVQIEDIIGTMFEEDTEYGVRHTVQPPEMYDIFAYYEDDLKLEDNQLNYYGKNPCVFTPDTFEYEGIVYRYKQYNKIKKNPKLKGIDLLNYIELQSLGMSNEKIIREKYLNQFNVLKENLIKQNNFIIKKLSDKEINIIIKINGIENKKRVKKEIYNKILTIPESPQELQDFVIGLSEDIKIILAGKEKVRNKDISAIRGLYPRKELSTHGLQLIKNLAHKDRQLERRTKITIKLAELQSLYIMKKTLRLSKNLALSCSFGMDSILSLYLLRKVKKDNYDIVFNNSLVEYNDTIKFKNEIIKEWDLTNVVETLPAKTYWELQKENGWNFQDKGDRTINKTTGKKVSASEQCCYFIKHLPMHNLITERKYDSDVAGVRADESRARLNAGKRDGVFYFASSWNLFRVNPILFWTNSMVIDYVKEKNIPYNEIYDKKLLDDDGKVIYEPRTGCWCCLLNAKRNYLKWLKAFSPKQYEFLMFNKGLAKDLYAMGMNYKIKKQNNQMSMFDNMNNENFYINEKNLTKGNLEHFENLIQTRPCMFLK
ncbi:phosphoadenosine phosphosulfate reductase family protein [Clostridium botulinum]|uniref:Phosphoadenosine phosphosulfate reductase family protein n=2 Tax=Clostridium botulinum TaxID=1491 RepID=B1IP10_CLOBK|nr:phosphoadenosine phosphosulfate reductase family protein [Clostridium botulinum]EKX79694.1 phosphoadenosine phosphosulfate reductase family protein [Clostridium botulinum CFSAN001628]ACA47076.1 phosphoadenosine phosphosulfate reductase family protein [Clostridium botulinum B1 str. Okra]MBD5563413.1 phosphoadenosine phosphosulfate reductase family protein [Clostridium botulinum]MBD5568264.1 phosphoadenosine phosphosulfate reductase family protein [Clostridium botulinum]MBD5571995.1 phosphoad